MKLEQQVVSLELAKRLKESGVKQQSYWYWSENAKYGYQLVDTAIPKEDGEENGMSDGISAFTVAELGELLPAGYSSWRGDEMYYCENDLKNHVVTEHSEADARAKMLVCLIENKLLTL